MPHPASLASSFLRFMVTICYLFIVLLHRVFILLRTVIPIMSNQHNTRPTVCLIGRLVLLLLCLDLSPAWTSEGEKWIEREGEEGEGEGGGGGGAHQRQPGLGWDCWPGLKIVRRHNNAQFCFMFHVWWSLTRSQNCPETFMEIVGGRDMEKIHMKNCGL